MRAITPLGRGLLVASVLWLVAVLVGSGALQIVGAVALVLAAGAGVRACVNTGQGLARLYP